MEVYMYTKKSDKCETNSNENIIYLEDEKGDIYNVDVNSVASNVNFLVNDFIRISAVISQDNPKNLSDVKLVEKCQCYYCNLILRIDELITKGQDDIQNGVCPKCGKDVFYNLQDIVTKDGKIETLKFATRV